MARDGELHRMRDEISVLNALNDELEQKVGSLENQLRIAQAELKAATLQVQAHQTIERVPLPTETHPTFDQPGKPRPASVYALSIPAAIEFAFGIPKGAMLGKFKQGPVAAAISKHYPKMRRSAARAILLDNECGKAVVEIPIWAKQRTALILDMLDTFETMLVDKQQAEASGR